ncbi:hypothetical protein JKP88DRAFT_284028 [Tribonema minus]|uniref:VASt domain-containing protein n=1 Tax=Tribonema minus TaxID=303371 RepID=A0A835YPT4_9STRA|nr:hypothetical protein JKP88DRAFT_284028 [Tribonema minus]
MLKGAAAAAAAEVACRARNVTSAAHSPNATAAAAAAYAAAAAASRRLTQSALQAADTVVTGRAEQVEADLQQRPAEAWLAAGEAGVCGSGGELFSIPKGGGVTVTTVLNETLPCSPEGFLAIIKDEAFARTFFNAARDEDVTIGKWDDGGSSSGSSLTGSGGGGGGGGSGGGGGGEGESAQRMLTYRHPTRFRGMPSLTGAQHTRFPGMPSHAGTHKVQAYRLGEGADTGGTELLIGECTQLLKFLELTERVFSVRITAQVSGVPYCDYFTVRSLWRITPSTDGRGSVVAIALWVEFSKPTLFKGKFTKPALSKGKIEKDTVIEQGDAFREWLALARSHLQLEVGKGAGGAAAHDARAHAPSLERDGGVAAGQQVMTPSRQVTAAATVSRTCTVARSDWVGCRRGSDQQRQEWAGAVATAATSSGSGSRTWAGAVSDWVGWALGRWSLSTDTSSSSSAQEVEAQEECAAAPWPGAVLKLKLMPGELVKRGGSSSSSSSSGSGSSSSSIAQDAEAQKECAAAPWPGAVLKLKLVPGGREGRGEGALRCKVGLWRGDGEKADSGEMLFSWPAAARTRLSADWRARGGGEQGALRCEALVSGECLASCCTPRGGNTNARRPSTSAAALSSTAAAAASGPAAPAAAAAATAAVACVPHYLLLRDDGGLALYRGAPPPGSCGAAAAAAAAEGEAVQQRSAGLALYRGAPPPGSCSAAAAAAAAEEAGVAAAGELRCGGDGGGRLCSSAQLRRGGGVGGGGGCAAALSCKVVAAAAAAEGEAVQQRSGGGDGGGSLVWEARAAARFSAAVELPRCAAQGSGGGCTCATRACWMRFFGAAAAAAAELRLRDMGVLEAFVGRRRVWRSARYRQDLNLPSPTSCFRRAAEAELRLRDTGVLEAFVGRRCVWRSARRGGPYGAYTAAPCGTSGSGARGGGPYGAYTAAVTPTGALAVSLGYEDIAAAASCRHRRFGHAAAVVASAACGAAGPAAAQQRRRRRRRRLKAWRALPPPKRAPAVSLGKTVTKTSPALSGAAAAA